MKAKKIQRINDTKCWFFLNKQDWQPPDKSDKNYEGKAPINKIRNEKGEVITNTKEIQGIIRD
jgi:hypothetical protein